jgi:hypothetical protein
MEPRLPRVVFDVLLLHVDDRITCLHLQGHEPTVSMRETAATD